jgi:hypothetical protein
VRTNRTSLTSLVIFLYAPTPFPAGWLMRVSARSFFRMSSVWVEGMLPRIGMRGLMTLPLFLLVLVCRLDSAVGRRSMSSVNGARIVSFSCPHLRLLRSHVTCRVPQMSLGRSHISMSQIGRTCRLSLRFRHVSDVAGSKSRPVVHPLLLRRMGVSMVHRRVVLREE